MFTARALRRLSFCVVLAATVFAARTGVLAMGTHISGWCASWSGTYDGECWVGDGFPPGWYSHGYIDLSEEEEPELTGAGLCNGLYDSCDEECGNDYADYVAEYYSYYLSQSDPCYNVATSPECYLTWADGSCDAGPTTTWSCGCQAFNICDCG